MFKALLVLVFLSPAVVWSHNHTELDGRWVLTDRVCSSGYAPTDNFRLGRDQYEIQFTRGNFRSYLRVGRCEQWVDGHVRKDARAITFFVHRWNSNCPGQVPPRFDYTYELNQNSLSIFMGPFNGPGSCGHGEYLESVFTPDDQPSGDDELPELPERPLR